jgi:NADPH:quinone reductase-like Zn-dependent oxidoreductase
MPSSVSFESAACLGVPGLTAAMTLWHWLQVPMPSSSIAPVSAATADTAENHLLIWGGSTITGQFAIQLAAYCGLTVIAVVSAKNAGLMSSLGAHHIILRDGQSNEDIVAAVRSITGDTLTKAIDIVGPKTAVCAMQALSHSRPAQLAPLNFLLPGQEVPVNVTVKNIEMKTFILDKSSRQYAVELNRLVREGKVKFPQLELLPGGLEAIPVGLERQKRGDMDGRKLIVSLR